MSENYFQHADHFMRILNEREIQKKNVLSSENANNSQGNVIDNNKVKTETSDNLDQ